MTKLEDLLQIIPGKIEHPILNVEWKNLNPVVKWSDYKTTFVLRMDKKDDKFSAYYVYTGFEGEQQILPMYDSEYKQYFEYGGVIEYEDIYKPTLLEALEDLLCWLKKLDLI